MRGAARGAVRDAADGAGGRRVSTDAALSACDAPDTQHAAQYATQHDAEHALPARRPPLAAGAAAGCGRVPTGHAGRAAWPVAAWPVCAACRVGVTRCARRWLQLATGGSGHGGEGGGAEPEPKVGWQRW